MEARLVTMNDEYSFDSEAKVAIEPFIDIVDIVDIIDISGAISSSPKKVSAMGRFAVVAHVALDLEPETTSLAPQAAIPLLGLQRDHHFPATSAACGHEPSDRGHDRECGSRCHYSPNIPRVETVEKGGHQTAGREAHCRTHDEPYRGHERHFSQNQRHEPAGRGAEGGANPQFRAATCHGIGYESGKTYGGERQCEHTDVHIEKGRGPLGGEVEDEHAARPMRDDRAGDGTCQSQDDALEKKLTYESGT